jgi:hypothetical protein
LGIQLSYAQTTVVKGLVTDSLTKQPLQSVSVYFKGGNGTVTDAEGKFHLETPGSRTIVQFSYVGYRTVSRTVVKGKEQELIIALGPDPRVNSVTVTTHKRAHYTNKNNPAVELIRKVIQNKSKNRMESYDYIEYEKYEKLQVALSNFSDKFTDSKFMKKYHFLFENKDTTKLEGKTLLPVYLEETLSKNYYRKSPEKKKAIITAKKRVNYGEYIDNGGVSTFLNRLYENIDIYDNNIPLFTNQFLSPIADMAPTFYMFYIKDTVTNEHGVKSVRMYFTPRNTNDFLFRGTMLITLDGNYAVRKMDMFISKNVNINFVREMHIDLDFEENSDGRYHLSKSDVMADAAVTKGTAGGFFGERTVSFKDYKINVPEKDSVYKGPAEVTLESSENLTDQFWATHRHDTLTRSESKVYTNIDSLEKMPSFRRTMAIASFLLAGYVSAGPVEIGPTNTFYSYNPVEGLKLRFGGRTLPKFSKRIYFETYGAYGFKDEKWKYFLSSTYSLNNKSIYAYPLNYLRASIQRDTKIPGQELQFVSEDNILLSLKRGINDKFLYNDFYKLDYVHEFPSHLSYSLGFKNWKQQPAGALVYTKMVNSQNENVASITATELSGELRWAPHEQFYQGKVYRIPIVNKYPIITLDVAAGVKGLVNGEYNYQRINLRFEKRFYASQFGYADLVAEGGYIFGKVPYPLEIIHRANQTYAYQLYSYNLMNFLEFVSDHYASANIDYFFNGFIFNRVPLLKKLKLREVVSIKALYGGVRDENNPALHPELIKYPENNGSPATYSLNKEPYVEGSVGIANIFKLIRVDLVKRFTYLDHPYIATWGIRTRFKFDF